MKFGVNYTPRRGWFHSWLDLDLAETREDFAQIAELGLDHVRLFPLWPLLQPTMGAVRGSALSDIEKVAGAATEAGLSVSVDVLQGHLSSFDFLPSWVQTWHHRNLFTDPDVISSQKLLISEMGKVLKSVDNVTGLCVGNEFPQFAAPRHPQGAKLTQHEARLWIQSMLDSAYKAWPDGEHVHCFDDDLLFDDRHPFTPPLVNLGAKTTVHAWIFGHAGRKFGRSAPQLSLFPRYICEVAKAWSSQGDRSIWLQEIGAPLNYLAEDEVSEFTENVCESLLSNPMPSLEAITWWCAYDVDRELQDFPALEYDLGLFTSQGKLKPVGAAFSNIAQKYRKQPPAIHDSSVSEGKSINVRLSDNFHDRSRLAPDGEIFAQWFESAKKGDYLALKIDDFTH